jgi:hypothetical protein
MRDTLFVDFLYRKVSKMKKPSESSGRLCVSFGESTDRISESAVPIIMTKALLPDGRHLPAPSGHSKIVRAFTEPSLLRHPAAG